MTRDALDHIAPDRRRLLRGLGAAGGLVGLAAMPTRAETPARNEPDAFRQLQPFHGPHQSGVTTPQPAAALVAAFDVLATSREELAELLQRLTRRIAFLMKGGRVADLDPRFPPPDSGVLGPYVCPDNLTITVGVGASLFDERFGFAAVKPLHLVRMEQFPNDALDAKFCHGDLLVQICSNTAETNIHALRDLIRNLPDLMAPRWKIEGFLPPRTIKRLGEETVRNLLGFKDGTANLDAGNAPLMDHLVWVGANSGEPAWTHGGTYQVVRIIRMLVERWDRTPLGEQQTIIGRDKKTGAPLGQQRENEEPAYAADPTDLRVPADAHIRLANPRRVATEPNRILRRGYNYSRGLTSAGQLDMGLLFVCFQANLQAGFLTVQNRLSGEPLEEYVKPTGGGYFFVLPGAETEEDFLGSALVKAGA